MSTIEDRLRDAMTARAQAVQDDHRPLPAPRTRRAVKMAPIMVAAAVVIVAVVGFGLVRSSPSQPGSGEGTVAMAMGGVNPSGRPGVSVFLCQKDSSFPACKGGEATEREKDDLLRTLRARPEVEDVTFQSQRQAWENFRAQNKDDAVLLRAVAVEDMPESFQVRIRPGADYAAVARAASELPDVATAVDQACFLERSTLWSIIKNVLPWSGDDDRRECSFMGRGR
ncbi:permease-like cell division protein FtsX [Streptosporangium sp. NPDC000396]|uniref:permease-like cell division protein FtsX n=1 Tax=Streptosporangium sp. NPDC000396 TaxID=3366185 RepID=UPI0036850493